jgi:MinD superfamily P-loop ATPase
MILTVASGKGGTGKTMVATSLALSLTTANLKEPPLFMDCDVEAPNAHLFLHPAITERQEVGLLIPAVDEAKCTHCGKCAEVCQYHAIAVLGQKTLVFPQLCHGCGSCTAMCPEKAITETADRLGVIERGPADAGITFARGVLDVGKPMAVPVIRQLKKWAVPPPGQVVIRDAPPGTSCPVVETARGSNYLLLVTEPTPFGLHDLKLAVQVASQLGIPVGVVINRENSHYPVLDEFCTKNNLPVLLRIPFERAIAEGTAQGKTLIDIHPEYQSSMQAVITHILAQRPETRRCFPMVSTNTSAHEPR